MKTIALLFSVLSLAACGGHVTYDATWSQPPQQGVGGTGGDGGGGTTATTTTTDCPTDCPDDCDDGIYCTIDVCVAGACEHLAYPKQHECSAANGSLGLCIWSTCAVTSCDGAQDGETCFGLGGLGVCEMGACISPDGGSSG